MSAEPDPDETPESPAVNLTARRASGTTHFETDHPYSIAASLPDFGRPPPSKATIELTPEAWADLGHPDSINITITFDSIRSPGPTRGGISFYTPPAVTLTQIGDED